MLRKTHRLHYMPTSIQLSGILTHLQNSQMWLQAWHHKWKQRELMSKVSPAPVLPASCNQWDSSPSKVRLHSVSKEKSGERAKYAGQCLKLLLIHFKLRSHWDTRDSSRKITAPPNSLFPLFSYRIGWRQNPGDRLWGRKGTRMDGMLGKSEGGGTACSLQRPRKYSCLQLLALWEPCKTPVSRSRRLSPAPANSRARHDTSAFHIIHLSRIHIFFSPEIAVSWQAKPSSHWTSATSARRSSRT